jgi:hypothetical protein
VLEISSMRCNIRLDTSHHGQTHAFKDAWLVANSLTVVAQCSSPGEPPKVLSYLTAENQFYDATGRRLPEILYYSDTASNFIVSPPLRPIHQGARGDHPKFLFYSQRCHHFIMAENTSTNFYLFYLTAATNLLYP